MTYQRVLLLGLISALLCGARADGQLVTNGDFETGDLTGWTIEDLGPSVIANGTFGIVSFGNFFYRAGADDLGVVSQSIDVSANATAIDAGQMVGNLTGALGSWENTDITTVTATFLDINDIDLGSTISISALDNPELNTGPVLGLTAPGNQESANGLIPVNTRTVVIRISTPRIGGVDNDGYVDDIQFELTAIPEPTSLSIMALLGTGFMFRRRKRIL